jgi:hypothetical protein
MKIYCVKCNGVNNNGSLHCDEATSTDGWHPSLPQAIRDLVETAELCGSDSDQLLSLVCRDVSLGVLDDVEGQDFAALLRIQDEILKIVLSSATVPDESDDELWSGTGKEAAKMEVLHTASGYMPASDPSSDGSTEYLDSDDAWVAEFEANGGCDN